MRTTRTSRHRWLPVRIDDFEKWQSALLEESARRLGALLDPGGRVHRWGFVGSPVMFRGQCAWLRVSPFLEHEMSGKAWRGTAEAAAIPGVSKPALLHRIEWQTDGTSPVPVSAEVLTLVTDPPASREGKASICKVGRDPQVDLIAEGADGLRRLAAAADALLTRHGGCTGCTLHKTCGTCMPLASLYRQAKAPLEVFCQHGGR